MVREDEPRLLAEAGLLGVFGALAAQLFTWLLRVSGHVFLGWIAGYQPPGLSEDGGVLREVIGPHGLWLIPVATTIGGVISGILVYTLAPEAEGHGTDAAVAAFHRAGGFIRSRVPPVKMLASAITIGSGGAAGREGPIALISAGIGSVYSTLVHKSEEQRRLLMLAGMAAGLSAIFRTPMGTGVFAIEVLYGSMEFEVDALLYTMLASAVAYAVNGLFVGWQPLFQMSEAPAPQIHDYAAYILLGVAAGLVGTCLPEVFYRVRDGFRALPLPQWVKPGIGGLGIGLIALKLPQVLGGGYGWIQEAIDGRLALRLLLILMFAKIVAFALTVSSGGSGGVFAPSLFVGAMLGGTFATVFHQPAAILVIVGMAAVFGAAARVPIATMLMVTEMAGGYKLLVPAGLAVMISYLLQVRLSSYVKYRSLYEAQVPRREHSPAHYLDHVRVALTLLGRRDVAIGDKSGSSIGHVDLLKLLRSKIRLDLPGGKQLEMGVLQSGSKFVGKPIQALYADRGADDFEVVAIMRREHVLLPHPDTLLSEGDRLLTIGSAHAHQALAQDISPLPSPDLSSGSLRKNS
ncbi:MAG: chloride channel protein [Terriglobales bacterium]